MPKQIVWSPLAENDLANILEFLFENWNDKVTNEFIVLTQNALEQISISPRQFPLIYKKKKMCVDHTQYNFLSGYC